MEELKEQVQAVLKLSEVFLAEYDNADRGQQCWQLFEVIFELTNDVCRQGVEGEQSFECSYDDLASGLTAKRNTETRKYVDNKRIRQLLDTLNKRLEETRPRWEQLAQEHGIAFLPEIRSRQGGGAGNKTVVWMTAAPICRPEDNEQRVTAPLAAENDGTDIHYYLESLPDLPVWTRWLKSLSFEKHCWGRWVLAAVAVVPYFSVVVLCFLPLLLRTGLVTQVSSGLITFLILYPMAFFALFNWIPRVLNNNIALLPDWMLPLRLGSAVLLLDLKVPGTEGYRVKGMGIRVYAAKCPVCHSRVDLKSGGLKSMARIVGVCDRNPLEHRYSFDFTNLSGQRLQR